MGITKLAIHAAIPEPKIENFEKYLFIGPHPDDIEIGAGATIAKLTEAGKTVSFLICMDGRYGDGNTDLCGDALASCRMEEAKDSAGMLGVTDVHFLNLKDGNSYKMKQLKKGIARVVGEVQPDIIFAPDPESKSELHPDHINVGKAAGEIACFAPYAGIMKDRFQAKDAKVQAIAFYMTAHPNRFVRTGNRIQKQYDAIFLNHLSQYPKDCSEAASLKLYLKLRSIEYGIRTFSRGAEGFRVLGAVQMHCLPETGE